MNSKTMAELQTSFKKWALKERLQGYRSMSFNGGSNLYIYICFIQYLPISLRKRL